MGHLLPAQYLGDHDRSRTIGQGAMAQQGMRELDGIGKSEAGHNLIEAALAYRAEQHGSA